MISIEDPLPDDAGEIFFVQRQTWHESYLDQVSHEEIEHRFTDAPSNIDRIKKIIEGKINGKFFVARDKDQDKIMGFISLLTQPRNEINSFYVIQEVQGIGIGRKLLKRALDWYGPEEVFVKSDDVLAFYEKFGFKQTKKTLNTEGCFPDMTELVRSAQSTTLG